VIFTIAKLIKILHPYIKVQQLSHFDRNLFNSFYSSISLEERPKVNMIGAVTKLFKKVLDPKDSQIKLL
jgi:hypothetical protein